jgi:transposase
MKNYCGIDLHSSNNVMVVINEQDKFFEKKVLKQVKLKPEFQKLLNIPGIGIIMAMTIMLETGVYSSTGRYKF